MTSRRTNLPGRGRPRPSPCRRRHHPISTLMPMPTSHTTPRLAPSIQHSRDAAASCKAPNSHRQPPTAVAWWGPDLRSGGAHGLRIRHRRDQLATACPRQTSSSSTRTTPKSEQSRNPPRPVRPQQPPQREVSGGSAPGAKMTSVPGPRFPRTEDAQTLVGRRQHHANPAGIITGQPLPLSLRRSRTRGDAR